MTLPTLHSFPIILPLSQATLPTFLALFPLILLRSLTHALSLSLSSSSLEGALSRPHRLLSVHPEPLGVCHSSGIAGLSGLVSSRSALLDRSSRCLNVHDSFSDES